MTTLFLFLSRLLWLRSLRFLVLTLHPYSWAIRRGVFFSPLLISLCSHPIHSLDIPLIESRRLVYIWLEARRILFFFFLAFCQIFPLTSTHDSPDLVAVFSFLSAFTCLIVTLAFCTKAFLSYCTTPAFNGLLLMWSISGIISFGFSTRSVCLLPMGSSRTAREWYSCILFHAMRKVRYTNIHELFCVF